MGTWVSGELQEFYSVSTHVVASFWLVGCFQVLSGAVHQMALGGVERLLYQRLLILQKKGAVSPVLSSRVVEGLTVEFQSFPLGVPSLCWHNLRKNFLFAPLVSGQSPEKLTLIPWHDSFKATLTKQKHTNSLATGSHREHAFEKVLNGQQSCELLWLELSLAFFCFLGYILAPPVLLHSLNINPAI